MMASDTSAAIGAEYRKETQRLLPKALLFGLFLLLSHFLELKPAEVSFGGVKLMVSDVAVIHGGLALVFLYYFWMVVDATFQGNVLSPLNVMPRTFRFLLANAKKPYLDEKTKRRKCRTPKQAKRYARWWIAIYQLFSMPFALAAMAIIIYALIFGLLDVWTFGNHLWENLERFN